MEIFDLAAARILACGDVTPKATKTQVSFYAKRAFAALSAGSRKGVVKLTIVLRRRIDDPRIAVAVEPRPGLWTHHINLRTSADLDETVDSWLREAYLVKGMGIQL